ncbi:MAG TPA: carboxyl transferase domain-containing protein [Thermodesulfobacteriota bacterium]|nr:carboxyl transferase domain-containing protein [Thermodesulfobacteriota bacterium]
MSKRKKDDSTGWEGEIEELRLRENLARQMGGEENLARHRAAGRLNVRERIHRLLDVGSFHETGTITGIPTFEEGRLVKLFPSNFVMGTGRIEGRRVVVGADDFTIRGGAADAAIGRKAPYAERMALDLRLPMIRLVDGTGGGGSVKYLERMDRTYIPANPAMEIMTDLLSTVPVVSAALGSVAGLGAARVIFSHFSVMPRRTAQLFVAGPPVVEAAFGRRPEKEELGGSEIHTRGFGAVDNEASSEEDAFEQIRKFLSYLPDSVYEAPPVVQSADPPGRREEELIRIVPREKRRPYPVRRILQLILDRESFFEIGGRHGTSVVTGLARLSGRPVGVMGHDPRFHGGAVTAHAADKMARFIDLCDTFHLPMVYFVDNPGFMIGVEAEKEGTIRFGGRFIFAVYQATVPWCSIILRRVFGVAGAAHGNHSRLNLRYAWPSGDWGSLPIEGGVQAAYRRQIEAAEDPQALREEIEKRLSAVTSPFRTAEMFGIEEIIDPRDTRPLLCEWVETAWKLLAGELGPKRRGMRP